MSILHRSTSGHSDGCPCDKPIKGLQMKKLSAPLAFVLSVLLIESSSVLAQSTATPAERPLIERIQGRTFPSVFQAWSPAQNVEDESPLHTVARHDLVFHGPEFFGLRWNRTPTGLADGFTAESIGQGQVLPAEAPDTQSQPRPHR